jgi:hypothetical protein
MEPIVELIETKTFVFEGGESIEMQSFTDSELGLEYVYEDETAPDDPTIFNNSNFSPEEAELIARLFTLPNFGEKGTGTVITWVSEYKSRVMVYSSGDGGWVIGYMRQDGTFATIYVDKLVGPLAKRLGVTE